MVFHFSVHNPLILLKDKKRDNKIIEVELEIPFHISII